MRSTLKMFYKILLLVLILAPVLALAAILAIRLFGASLRVTRQAQEGQTRIARMQVEDRLGRSLAEVRVVDRAPADAVEEILFDGRFTGRIVVVPLRAPIDEIDGRFLLDADRAERDGPAKYMLPSGIAVDEDGRVYMVDQWFRKIDVFRPARLRPEDGYLVRRPATAAAGK